ncbi:Citrinin biosynthesis cluster MFS transporter mrr1 [Pseudocercospora fuligena]|uniref:Cercosporin MFS transporter CTB4 n=1 Tax=Pseudocercospora fuligena TaxID=685502 RepID=A0A8H6R5Y1_9PEZI|nr:Citrinin biosynthesis cluster MFS transporter mrr1 [Pseudocercospora fuligena]
MMDPKTLEAAAYTETQIVDWDGPSDPARPENWSSLRKWTIVVTTTLMTAIVSFASSVFSATIEETKAEFDVSSTVMLLGITLYVLGFAIGPCIWGPASELYGRTQPMWVGTLCFLLFQIPLGLARDASTILVSRFFAGLFGSAPLAIVAGMYVDFLGPIERGISTAIFSVGCWCGPVLGPVIGNIATAQMGWRSTAWITMISGASLTLLAYSCTPETSEPILLKRKAIKLRVETSNWALHARSEEKPADAAYFVRKYLTKPLKMLFLEPILMIFTAYMSLVYGILYLSLTLYPFAFKDLRGWTSVKAGLPFLSQLIGIVLGCLIIGLHGYFHCKKALTGRKLMPEDRLPPVVLGSALLPIGLFVFSWTSDPSQSPIPQVLAGVLIGSGAVLVFMSSLAFLVETYLFDANSALAINTFFRCSVAAVFPLLSLDMFDALGIKWSGSLLGFICIGLAPFPLLMLRFGSTIRGWSKFACV